MVLLQTKHKLQLGLCVCATKMRLGLLYARNARCPALPCLGFRSLAECRKRRGVERGEWRGDALTQISGIMLHTSRSNLWFRRTFVWEYHESEWKCDCERESKWAQAEGEIERKKFPCRAAAATSVGKTKPTTEEEKRKPSTGAEQMMLSDAQLLWKWKPSSILKMHEIR